MYKDIITVKSEDCVQSTININPRPARPKMQVKKLHSDAVVPVYAHEGDSGMDLYTVEDLTLKPGATGIAPTGIAVALPPYTELQVRNRSGITIKGCECLVTSLVVDSIVTRTVSGDNNITYSSHTKDTKEQCYERVLLGTVDNPYRGEIGIMVYNQEDKTVTIPKRTKLAQAVICPIVLVDVEVVNELSETNRGTDGYGSTGI